MYIILQTEHLNLTVCACSTFLDPIPKLLLFVLAMFTKRRTVSTKLGLPHSFNEERVEYSRTSEQYHLL
jgi:hypothetical protein